MNAPAKSISPLSTFKWLLKREFWEHRGGFLWAPVIAGSIITVLYAVLAVIGTIAGRNNGHGDSFNIDGGPDKLHEMIGAVGDGTMLAGVLLACIVLGFVVFFYALGSLYDDRRDRSVLFWKSLPVSDLSTVLSKAAWALLLAPIVAIGVGLLIGLALWVVTALTISVNGIPQSSAVFTHSHPLRIIGGVLSNLPIYVMWALPTIGWLMFCSAWARSKPFLWAVLIPILGCVMASMMGILPMLHINHKLIWYTVVYRGLLSVLPGTWLPVLSESAPPAQIDGPQDLANAIQLSDAWRIFQSADIWIGAAIGVAFIVAAIYLRRWRDEA
ncbi:ABC transporter permease [Xanthomonas sp. AM6]|uniref:ABC transporter permease n=1 Tax=Xanthomonas sp. AM6 TaxID=2982531 RepID=UPI0021DB5381|nr:ABC transporter permease [Xanthomonas sp. AM6]UYB54048.1 ABC transporter permease [Xanthomonas sp. AM6]